MNINAMNLKEKIGQLFIVGFQSQEVDNQLETLVKEYNAGNVVLFFRNIKDAKSLKELNENIQKLIIENNKIKGFICADQEGGMVNRIRSGATEFPGNMAVAASNIDNVTEKLGAYMGEELRYLGINMNLAPVLDVNNNEKNPVIAIRSYGDNPQNVARLGCGMINGLQSKNVLAVGKHFPGHGDTSTDSHLDLPTVNQPIDRLESVELVPFIEAIKNNVDGIMSAHILFPTLEKKNIPATLSKTIITGVLREKLGFKGLVISDCMEMNAISKFYGTEEAAVMAIEAGVNLVCVCHTLEKQVGAMKAVEQAVLSGRIPMEVIDERVSKVLEYKEKYFKNDSEIELTDKNIKLHEEFVNEVSENSITLVRDNNNLLPVSSEVSYVISPVSKPATIADDEFEECNFAKEIANEIGCKYINYKLNMIDSENIVKNINEDNVIIFGSNNLTLSNEQQNLLDSILEKTKNVILVSLRNPYDVAYRTDKIGTALATYEYTKLAVSSVKKVLIGEKVAKGKLPIKLN